MVLDEPTNSMDRQSEKVFVKKLEEILADQTVILITHKTSMLSLVDRVIVFDNGRIVADGPKDKILSSVKDKKDETDEK